jgi:hypothetical protein
MSRPPTLARKLLILKTVSLRTSGKEKQNYNEKTCFLRLFSTGELARAGHNSISKSKPYYQ